jgi:hypothetical protein
VKPNGRQPTLARLARQLGWSQLQMERHTIRDSLDPKENGTVIEWFFCGDFSKVLFQINEEPWRACVFAIRHRLSSGWHEFRFPQDDQELRSEARRLGSYLSRDAYASDAGRMALRQRHPECTHWTWKRLRMEKPPYHGLQDGDSPVPIA